MKRTALLLFLSAGLLLHAATPEKVNLLNRGKMYIAPTVIENGASMYVQHAVRCDSVAHITLNGVLKIGGSFIQDSKAHVFATGSNGYTTSTGKLVFTSSQKVARHITTTNFNSFNRGTQYIAFPHIVIETTDTIVMPARMGIDALSVKRNHIDSTGFFLLKSDITGTLVYDASLRITGTGSSTALVDAGAVIVEQYMGAYRGGNQLFPFATPYHNTQLSGYFAGNWVRQVHRDDMQHSAYVLGNKPAATGSNVINLDQYVINARDKLSAGTAYLIQPRPAGFDYGTLQATGGLALTGAEASLYDQNKFTFNGNVYTLPAYQEQLFADDALFTHTFPAATPVTGTLNWVIGNSYSAPLSIDSIRKEIEISALVFAPYIYIYSLGTTSYQAVSLSGDGISPPYAFDEIPAKSVFMIRVSRNQTGSNFPAASFTIGKKHLRHGNLSHNLLRASAADSNRDIGFRITPEENSNIYDLTAIGLRQKASLSSDTYDIPKIYTTAQEGFQLYTNDAGSSKLSANGIPLDADSVLMGFKPQAGEMSYALTVSQKNEGELWLKDLKTDAIIDLLQTPFYSFTGTGSDAENRFIVYLKEPERLVTASVSPVNTNSDISVNFSGDRLTVSGLCAADINARVYIYETTGKAIFSDIISHYPQQEFNTAIPTNVYIVSIRGQRNFNSKVIK
ncbi:MAG: hypothetical protein LBR81_06785 [Prevotellaceae bacterium]|nr:hypothetical protein [Prevotellaceae bacterium]